MGLGLTCCCSVYNTLNSAEFSMQVLLDSRSNVVFSYLYSNGIAARSGIKYNYDNDDYTD